jgi:hypothetical protein
MLLRRVTLLLCVVASASGCAATASGADTTTTQLSIGRLPPPVTDPQSTVASTGGVGTTTTLAAEDTVGARAKGNRVILIGDSVMASTSRRYSNDMCDALVPLGWQVEVDAETGRFIDFGKKVLDKRLSAGWDVSVILLGNNYGEDQNKYRTALEQLVERLSPNPVVLLTVTEFKPSRAEVNAVIAEMVAAHDNVIVADWATVTRNDPALTGADRLHLTTVGRQALAQNVALALGQAPEQPGVCLKTSFTDDSSGPVTGTTVHRRSTTTTSDPSPAPSPDSTVPTSDTVAPTVAPTTPNTTSATTVASIPPVSAPPDTTLAASP